MSPPDPPVLFFDARCLLCHRSVRWILRHDREGVFSFAGLDSETARQVIPQDHPLLRTDTVILWDGERFFGRSTAAFKVLARLRTAWKWLLAFSILPRRLTDTGYRFIARHRYRWFGTDESCPIPDPEHAERFLP